MQNFSKVLTIVCILMILYHCYNPRTHKNNAAVVPIAPHEFMTAASLINSGYTKEADFNLKRIGYNYSPAMSKNGMSVFHPKDFTGEIVMIVLDSYHLITRHTLKHTLALVVPAYIKMYYSLVSKFPNNSFNIMGNQIASAMKKQILRNI